MVDIHTLLSEFETQHESRGMIDDLRLLYNSTLENKYKNILELGILHGNSTRIFALAAKNLKKCKVTSVDIEEGCCKEVYEKLKQYNLEKYIEFVTSDSIEFLLDQPDNSFDCIFLDTSHTFKQTVVELFLCGIKIKQNGGHIFLHDIHMPGVSSAIDLFLSYNPHVEYRKYNTPAGLGFIVMKRRNKK